MTKRVEKWLTSAEVREVLKISTCDLAHLREEGGIQVEKRGNAYYYWTKDVETLRGKRLMKGAGFCRIDEPES